MPLGVVGARARRAASAVRWHEADADAPPLIDEREPVAAPARGAVAARTTSRASCTRPASPPECVWLEITESTLMRDAESALSALGALRALGLHLAVDDFGSGYSSLAYLQRLPVEALKIDRSFVEGVGSAQDSTAIVDAIVEPAPARSGCDGRRGHRDHASSSTQLRAIGCEMGQGFLFGAGASRPSVFGDDPAVTVPDWGLLGAPQRRHLRTA